MTVASFAPNEVADGRQLKLRFLRWQCRSRQNAMRMQGGKPDRSMIAEVTPNLKDNSPRYALVTVLCRQVHASVLPEIIHMAKRTHDPAERHGLAVQFMSASYFQNVGNFTGDLSACVAAGSAYMSAIGSLATCRLRFRDRVHVYDLPSHVERLRGGELEREEIWWHNYLFNPRLDPDAEVIAFRPVWPQARIGLSAARVGR